MSSVLEEPLRRLYALAPRGALLGLERVQRAAEKLGDVHHVGPYAHVAGTNGKGSTSAMLASMLRVSGLKVGLYTSPHLVRFAERIQIDGKPIEDDFLADSLNKVLAVSDELTFFEVATLTAMVAFREAKVDTQVLEVGLGGRLDATNIAEGRGVSIITRIAFDHTDRLGTSLAAIAGEKAGILRPGAPCVTGRLHPDATAVVLERAAMIGAPVYEASTDDEKKIVDRNPPSLPGLFQRQNAMVAVAAARAFGLEDRAIGEGLRTTVWPGRFEVIEAGDVYVILDGAHNVDGALALKNSLGGLGPTFPRKSIVLLFGVMADKNWKPMLDRLSSVTGPRFYVAPQGREAVAPETLAAYLPGKTAATVEDAIEAAREVAGHGGLVVVCGSLFLVGAARAYLLGLPKDPVVAL